MSEIRVNTIVAAEGTSAPNLPYGIQVPTGMGITGAGGLNITGVCTATSFSGSGANLTGIAATESVRTSTLTVAGVSTFTGASNFSAAVNVDATTDSTSATSGALIVDGGLGVAKNVYIGAGLSVAGTLTYEDVTSVDSVGLITAKSGVNITGGELTVGSGITMNIAGVATFSGTSDVHLLDNVEFKVGDGSDLKLYHDGSDSYIQDAGTGDLIIKGSNNLDIKSSGDELKARFITNGSCELYEDNVKVFNTTDSGTITTGVSTATGGISLNADSKKLTIGVGSDLSLYHDGSHSFISNAGGTGNLVVYGNNTNSIVLQAQAGDNGVVINSNDSVQIYWDGSERIRTTGAGTSCVGISTVQDFSSYGMLRERVEIVANKLSANTNVNIENGNVYYYTTNETTTATPNIRYSSSQTLNNSMLIGETVTVTIIYKPNGSGYYAALTVDGSGVTEEWNGGSAPASANAGGYDVLTHTLVKTADATFLCLSNVSNFA